MLYGNTNHELNINVQIFRAVDSFIAAMILFCKYLLIKLFSLIFSFHTGIFFLFFFSLLQSELYYQY